MPVTIATNDRGTRLKEDLRILQTEFPRESKTEILTRLTQMFESAIDHTVAKKYRKLQSLAYKFYQGDQWTPQEEAELIERGQPVTVRNEIKPVIDRLRGQAMQTYQQVTFVGRNTPQDDAVAGALADIKRHIDQRNELEFIEGDMTEDGLVGGFGVYKVFAQRGPLGNMEIFKRYVDPLDIYFDPYSKHYDWNIKGKFIIEAPWMDIEDAVEAFPGNEAALRQCLDGAGAFREAQDGVDASLRNSTHQLFADPDRRRIRPAQVWYKRKLKVFHILSEGSSFAIEQPLPSAQMPALESKLKELGLFTEVAYVDRMYVGIFCDNVLIHHDRSPNETNLFPYVPYWAEREKDGTPYGPVKNLIPINVVINKRESKAVNALSNRRIIAEENAVNDIEEARKEAARADGYVEVQEGALTQKKIIIGDNTDIGVPQLNLLQESKDAMQRMVLPDVSLGRDSEVRSGIGIQRKQQAGNLGVQPLFHNLRRTRRIDARLTYDLIKQYVNEEITFAITDDLNAARTVTVTSDTVSKIKQFTYDVVVKDIPDYQTVREQQLDLLFTLFPQIAQFPGLMKVAIQMSELREKEALMQLIDQAMQPKPEVPKTSLAMSYHELSAEEKAAVWATMFQRPEMAQIIMQDQPGTVTEQKIEADLAKTKIKVGAQAMMESGKSDERAAQIALDGLLRAEEIKAKANGTQGSSDTV